MPSPWTYSLASKRYRNTDTGRFMSAAQMVELRDTFVDAMRVETRELADQLGAGEITLQQWEGRMRSQLKTTYIDEYVLGRGGRNAMTPANWGEVGGLLGNQYRYLHRFAEEVAAGTLSTAQIGARAELYVESGSQAYERGRCASFGLPRLSQYPGDGWTACGTNCRCSLDIKELESEWQVTWKLGIADHCEDCERLSGEWTPLVIPKAA